MERCTRSPEIPEYVFTSYYLHFTVFRVQNGLLHPHNGLWTPVSFWNVEVSQATFGGLRRAVTTHACKNYESHLQSQFHPVSPSGGMIEMNEEREGCFSSHWTV